MHELSIAMSILDCVAEESLRQGGDVRITAVHVKLGPLSGVVKEALESAYEAAAKASKFPGARLRIEETPVIAFCSKCGEERTLASMQVIRCPICQTPTPDIRSGRELEIAAVEISE